MRPDSPYVSSILIIANPRSGTTSPKLVDAVLARCLRAVPATTLYRTTALGDATSAAKAADADTLVVAVGGDGTVREVVQGLVAANPPEQRPTLMIVPAGTGNSNYLAQWADLPWADALTSALGPDAVTRRLDLCRLAETGELILLGACSGLIAEALHFARDIALTGRARYVEAMTRAAAAHRPYPGRVVVDGRTVHEGPTVLANVGGGRYRGGTYQVLPHSVLDDGLLDVCVIGAETPAGLVPELTVDARHLDRAGVVYARGRTITVESVDGSPVCFEHDGELVPGGHSSYTLEVLAGALPVRCRADG